MNDKELTCKICGKAFLFSVNEQLFYTSRVLDEPKRCPECRAKRRREEILEIDLSSLKVL